MAYDINDPADLAALKSEATTDPIGMGYDINGATQQLLKQFNDPALNVNGDVSARAFSAESLMDALDPTEFDSPQTQAEAAQYSHILVEMAAYSDIEPYKAKWRAMFAANSATVAALDSQTSALSRAEVLFGAGTNISRDDWFAARDS